MHHIRSSPILITAIRQLAESPPASRAGRRDGHPGQGEDEYDDDNSVDQEGEGEGEITSLARRILDLTESGRTEGEGGSHFTAQPGQQQGGQGQQGGEHDALRASVHQALRGQH